MPGLIPHFFIVQSFPCSLQGGPSGRGIQFVPPQFALVMLKRNQCQQKLVFDQTDHPVQVFSGYSFLRIFSVKWPPFPSFVDLGFAFSLLPPFPFNSFLFRTFSCPARPKLAAEDRISRREKVDFAPRPKLKNCEICLA